MRLLALTLLLGVALAGPASAQAQGLDDTFGIDGTVFTPLVPAASDRYLGAARAPGGGTYNVGYTTVAGTDRAFALTRVDDTGTLMSGFGIGGIAMVNVVTGPYAAPPVGGAPTGMAEVARGVVVQSDGKIVIAGQAETPPAAGKPDSRDVDIYVARFHPTGLIDDEFGDNGVRRVDLSNGVAAGNSVNSDQAYGLNLRPGGEIVVIGAKGTDSGAPAKTDRDLALVQLTTEGDLDGGFGVGGVAVSPQPGIDENPRQGSVDSNGRVVAVSYGIGIGGQTRPFVHRFLGGGTPDPGFGSGGIATAEVGGPAPGFAEAYDVALQGDRYVVAGYGTRSSTPSNGIDAVVYRFNADGSWDRTFGDDGLASYDRIGGPDRGRDLSLMADGRIVVAGSAAGLGPSVGDDGLLLVLGADGAFDCSTAGAVLVDLGGPNDSYFGSTTVFNGTKVVATGYRGGALTFDDEAALTRFEPPPSIPCPPGSTVTPRPDTSTAPTSQPAAKPKLVHTTRKIKPGGTAKLTVECAAACRLAVTLRIAKRSIELNVPAVRRTGRTVVKLKIPKRHRKAIAAARRSRPNVKIALRVRLIQGNQRTKPVTIAISK